MSSRLKEHNRNPEFPAPDDIFTKQVMLKVSFWSFADRQEEGRIVVHEDVAQDVRTIFDAMLREKFPLASVIPASDPRFAWDDGKMMAANNTSAFNYRAIAGTERLSYHAYGRAIDINPALNPYIRDGRVDPPGALYDASKPGTIVEGSFLTKLFDELGWEWGGRWTTPIDYQHFQKP